MTRIQIRSLSTLQAYMRQPNGSLVATAEYEQIAEDYRKAGEHHASLGNFAAAAKYALLEGLYSPNPEPESQDIELDWESVEAK